MHTPEPRDRDRDPHSEAFLHSLMTRQFRLSRRCAAAFLLVLLGLPLANFFLPDFMATRIWGFTLSWLVLGVCMFPLVWLIAWLFIRRSIALEEEEIAEVRPLGPQSGVPTAGASVNEPR